MVSLTYDKDDEEIETYESRKNNLKKKSAVSNNSSNSSVDNTSLASDPEIGHLHRHHHSINSHSTQHSSLSSIGGHGARCVGQIFRDKNRQKWPNQMDAILPLIAFAVGISDISKFPLIACANGGAAFFIPYIIFYVLCAFPVISMELIMGQFIQQGILSVWKIAPIFKGIGYSIQMGLWMFTYYKNSILTWAIMYIAQSFVTPLPYTTCNNDWNTHECIVPTIENYNAKENQSWRATAGAEFFRGRLLRLWPSKFADGESEAAAIGMTQEEYSRDNVTKLFGLNTKLGQPVWDLAMCNFFIFCCFFVILICGIKLSRKIIWITCTLPYVLLAVIFFRGVTLKGSGKGIESLMTPDFSKLLVGGTWINAALHNIHSTGAGFGIHLTLASFNNFKQNIFRDATIVCVIDLITSVFTAILVYCYVGDIAFTQGRDAKDVVTDFNDGIDIVFELIPDSFGKLSGARFFVIIYFSMIFLIGFDTGMIVMQTITVGFLDEFKSWFPKGTESKNLVSFALTSFAFVISLLSVTRGGIFIYKFMDQFSAGISLLLTILIQITVVSWLWGMEELCSAAEVMTGWRPGLYKRACWKYISPITLIFLTVLEGQALAKVIVEYNHERESEDVLTFGKIFTYIPVMLIPLYAFYQLYSYPAKSFKQKFVLLISPENEHGDIKKGRHYTNRLSLNHCFYMGWFAAFRVCCSGIKSVKIQPTATEIVVDPKAKGSRTHHSRHRMHSKLDIHDDNKTKLTIEKELMENPQQTLPNLDPEKRQLDSKTLILSSTLNSAIIQSQEQGKNKSKANGKEDFAEQEENTESKNKPNIRKSLVTPKTKRKSVKKVSQKKEEGNEISNVQVVEEEKPPKKSGRKKK